MRIPRVRHLHRRILKRIRHSDFFLRWLAYEAARQGVTREDIFEELKNSNAKAISSDSSDPGITVYRHGDTFTFTDALLGSASVIQKAFSGGDGGIVESLSVGASVPDTGASDAGWNFTVGSSTAPVVYNDSVRGKVMHSTYGASNTDLNATKGFGLNAGIAEGKYFYIARKFRSEIKTTAGANYPSNAALQHKSLRPINVNSIEDSADNSRTQLPHFNWYGGSGKQYRLETGDGHISCTITSVTNNTLTDTSKNWVPNSLVERGCQLTNGSGQFSRIISNTNNTITVQFAWSPNPTIGQTFEIRSGSFYGTSNDIDLNAEWQTEEYFGKTNTQNQPNGEFTHKVRKAAGVYTLVSKAAICLYHSLQRFQYFNFQDYFGNAGQAVTSKATYSDDICVIVSDNPIKRLVLTNNLTLDSATIYENQDYATWLDGTISGEINVGGIQDTGSYYLCAVEGLNTVIWSTEISIEINQEV